MKKATFPRLISWMALIGITFLIFITIMRFIFFFHFRPPGYALSENLNVFLLGLQFDLRIVCGIVLFPFLLGNIQLEYNSKKWLKPGSIFQVFVTLLIMIKLIGLMEKGESPFQALIYFMEVFFGLILIWIFISKNCNPFENAAPRKIFKIYFLIISILVVFFYVVDFLHYDYLHQRLNASVWNYTDNAKISMNMAWQTYPVITILLLIITGTVLLYGSTIYWFKRLYKKNYHRSIFVRALSSGSFAILLGIGIFGNLHLFPYTYSNALKWSDAFSFQDGFKANLALNPVQSFLSTLQYGNSFYDLKKVKESYPLMVKYLDIKNPDSVQLNYDRPYKAPQKLETPNVVLVICESFSGYKSSMWGNPLNTTPYFNEICKQGIFFDRCFTPGYGTAQGVWATITGIPDVEYKGTSSQNPAYVNQHSIINNYKGYDKFYFIGGSSSWANLRGLFENNIKGIKIYDETNLKSKSINVWGISDKNLFLEASEVFKAQTKPFFAVIQTSGNHRPYTIDDDDKKEFKLESHPLDTLLKYGFQSDEELNSFRYTDFSFKKFIETAKKENYFNNTIFVFVGDHGIPGIPPKMFPLAWDLDWLCYNHVPLLFYAPTLLSPRRINNTVSQLDVLPSVSALANISFNNTTLGRNLFDTLQNNEEFKNARFLFNLNEKAMGIVTDQYVYMYNQISGTEDFRSSKDNLPLPQTTSLEEIRKKLKTMTEAYFQTAKYMLNHNKKDQ